MFEHSLISLDKKKTARRWLSLPIAVALHLVALAGFTFAGYWHVERVSDPPVNDPFIQVSLPGLPQAKISQGGGSKEKVQKTAVPATHTEIAQPREPGDKEVTETPTAGGTKVAEGPGDPLGDPHGDPRGSVFGVPGVPFDPNAGGGGGGGGIGGLPAAAPTDEPIHVTGAVTRPVLQDGPQPRYTEMARRAGVQGTVVVEAVIDETGRVTKVEIIKALPMGLDLAAVEAVRSWRFQPATLAGRPVKVFYTLTVHFTLQH
jgi:protein TonB